MNLTKEWKPLKEGVIEQIDLVLEVSRLYLPILNEQQRQDFADLEQCSKFLHGEITRLPVNPGHKIKLKRSGVT